VGIVGINRPNWGKCGKELYKVFLMYSSIIPLLFPTYPQSYSKGYSMPNEVIHNLIHRSVYKVWVVFLFMTSIS
jgi:hypothetical protein